MSIPPYGDGTGSPPPYDPTAAYPSSGGTQPTPGYSQPDYSQPGYAQPGFAQPNPYAQPNLYGPPAYAAAADPYQPYPGGYPAQRTNALAVASLACSLGGLLTCVSAPVGVVLGHLAKRQIRETGEQGDGLATAGLWVGYILTIGGVLLVVGWLLLFVIFLNSSLDR
jgi:hypothetical protein